MNQVENRRPVLLYDGDCGLCNRVVRILLRADKTGRLHYAPLQSGPAQAYLRAQGQPTNEFDTLVFVMDWAHPSVCPPLFRTEGALAAAEVVGGGLWRAVGWTRFIPARGRDLAYKLIARSRYALFGEYRRAPLPEPAWEERFLARQGK